MNNKLSHWLHPKQSYEPADIALLLAGIDPYLVGKKPVGLNNSEELLNTAKEQALPGWENAIFYYGHVIRAMIDNVIDSIPGLEIFKLDELGGFFEQYDIKEFPKGYPISSHPDFTKNDYSHEFKYSSQQTLHSIIGALVTVLAELDESKERPLKNKKLIRADGISARAVADVISKRFEGSNLPLKRSNTAISEALKLIEEAEKAYV